MRLSKNIFCFPVLGFIFLAHVSSARELYVNPSNPAASNLGNATPDEPLLSLQVAASQAKAGDTVWVSSGTYREEIVIPSGKSGRPVLIKAMPGSRPLITGLDIICEPWTSRANGIFYAKRSTPTQIVVANGKPLTQVGEFSHVTPSGWKPPASMVHGDAKGLKPGQFYYSKKLKLLAVRLPDNSDPSKALIEAASRSTGVQLGSQTRLEGIDVSFFQGSDSKEGNGIVAGGENIEITDCRSNYNDFSGIYPQGTDITVRNCEAAWNGNNGFTSSFGSNIRLLDCRTSNNNTRRYEMSWHGGGLKFVQQRNLIIDNHHSQEEAIGLWLDINCTDAQVSNSTMKNCEIGLYYEISRWGVFVNNVFKDCDRGLWSYSSDVLIAHNAFVSCKQSIVVQGDPRYAEYRMGHGVEPGQSDNTLVAVRNNVIVNNLIASHAATELTIWPDNPTSSGHLCNRNAYISIPPIEGDHSAFRFCSTWGVAMSLDQWQERGFDQGSIFVWPTKSSHLEEEPPLITFTAGQFVLEPPNHPAKTAGRSISPSLQRGPSAHGRPWSFIQGSKKNENSSFELNGLFYNSWQTLPPQQKIADFAENQKVPVGPLPKWIDPGFCPRFSIK